MRWRPRRSTAPTRSNILFGVDDAVFELGAVPFWFAEHAVEVLPGGVAVAGLVVVAQDNVRRLPLGVPQIATPIGATRTAKIRQSVLEVFEQNHAIHGPAKIAESLNKQDDLEVACRNTA